MRHFLRHILLCVAVVLMAAGPVAAQNTKAQENRKAALEKEIAEIDRQLTTKLKAEVSGILNWVLQALPGLMNRGAFTESGKCEKALERYRLQSDNVRLFLNDICESSESTTDASDVYTAYKNYCFDSSLKPLGKQKFYDRLATLVGEPEMYGNLKRFRIKVTAV